MKRLIVTADDFGLSPGVVAGILEAHERGIVTSASLMVNAPATQGAIRAARNHPSLAVGLHFVLSFGKPTGPLAPLENLVNPDGTFRRPPDEVHARARPDQVREELRAQLSAFEAGVGRPPTHIDGHHHVHVHPGVLGMVIDEAHRLGIPVRAPDEDTRERLRLEGIPTTDAFVDRFYGTGAVDEAALVDILASLPEGTTELMCHPARRDEHLESLTSYDQPRYRELETLVSPQIRSALSRYAIELIPPTRLSG